MKILICGSDGYIGYPLTLHLLKQGHEVYGIDNHSRRRRVNELKSDSLTPILSVIGRIGYLNQYENFAGQATMSLGSDSPGHIKALLSHFKPDTIIHLAEQPSAPWSMQSANYASATQHGNVIGTLDLLWAMHEECPEAHLVKLGCYDEETEVLTENGWKYFPELTINDTICCINSDTEEIEYHNPSEVYKFRHTGKMIECKTKSLDMKLTPNHRVAYRSYTNNGVSKINIMQADQIKDHRAILIPRSGKWSAEDIEYFSIPSCQVKGPGGRYFTKPEIDIPMDLWMHYIGHYLADGSIRCRPNPNTARIGVSKGRKIRSLLYLKDKLELYGVNISVHHKENGITEFDLNNSQIATYLHSFGLAKEKYIPRELLNCSSRQLKILYHSLSTYGDGSNNGVTSYFTTTSKNLADDFQEICLKIGLVANISKSNRGEINISVGSKNLNTELHSDRVSEVDFDGYVYCCSVPTGIIMTRRNGVIAWSGNTMGEYGTPNCDIPEGEIPENCIGNLSEPYLACPMSGLLFPRTTGSFYHLSKVHDTLNIHFACRNWGLCSTDIMQGVVFGLANVESNEELTRFDYDECFGTVINRFCVQAIVGQPLTIYGEGGQTRGFLTLNDSIQCLTIAIENPPFPGEYRTLNQFESIHSINHLAEMVREACSLPVAIRHIENPRKEAEQHYYNPTHQKLFDLGYVPTTDIQGEISKLLQQLFPFRDKIHEEIIMPKISWK